MQAGAWTSALETALLLHLPLLGERCIPFTWELCPPEARRKLTELCCYFSAWGMDAFYARG